MGFLDAFKTKEEDKEDKLTIKERVIKTSLAKMFTDSHFSICTIDDCMKVAEVKAEQEVYNMLHALHCVHWARMDKQTRAWVAEAVVGIFCPENYVNLDFLEQIKVEAKKVCH